MRVERLHETAELAVERLHGPVRDAVDGRHRKVLVLVSPTTSAGAVAALLRTVADHLDRLAPVEVEEP